MFAGKGDFRPIGRPCRKLPGKTRRQDGGPKMDGFISFRSLLCGRFIPAAQNCAPRIMMG